MRWDLSRVDLIDQGSGRILAPVYPLDKTANADARRAVIEPGDTEVPPEDRGAAVASLRPLKTHPPRVLGHGHAAGRCPRRNLPSTPRRHLLSTENHHEQQETARALRAKVEPVFAGAPSEGLLTTPKIEHFAWRVEQLVQEGGFALITGESGTGKSVALRIVAGRLAALRDVTVGVIERPQSRSGDFYASWATSSR